MNKEKKEEKINNLLEKLVTIRRNYSKNNNSKLKKELKKIQEQCVIELDFLVEDRVKRYKNFSNYDDLYQDGRLALLSALQSYDPEKGDFYWWANKYIKTKISREANRHSTIKIPLKHTKQILPYKVSQLPIIIDKSFNAVEKMEQIELQVFIRSIINKLPEDQKKIIELHYEIQPSDTQSLCKICKLLKISRMNCLKLLNEAKNSLKKEIINIY